MTEPTLQTSLLFAAFAGALTLGVTGSLHCLAMCGPLACAAGGGRAGWLYQLGRLLSYGLVGTLLGGVGGAASLVLATNLRPYVPWVMAAALVATALDLFKRVPAIPGLARAASAISRLGAGFSPPVRAAAIGAATPLLPCGLSYGVYATALTTGSALGGAAVGLGFALGAVPLLVGAQLGTAFWGSRWRFAAPVLKRALPLAAALFLVVRATLAATAEAPRCH